MKVKELFEAGDFTVASVFGSFPSTYDYHLDVSTANLTSLLGSPHSIVGDFRCEYNRLKTLENGPVDVGGSFDCTNNMLMSLKYAPHRVGGEFDCAVNDLVSLVGAPAYIGENLRCSYNRLTSLKGIHKQIKHIGGQAYFTGNLIESHILGLLKIEGLEAAAFSDLFLSRIINKHLKGDKDIFACQEELIEAGYPEFAQL